MMEKEVSTGSMSSVNSSATPRPSVVGSAVISTSTHPSTHHRDTQLTGNLSGREEGDNTGGLRPGTLRLHRIAVRLPASHRQLVERTDGAASDDSLSERALGIGLALAIGEAERDGSGQFSGLLGTQRR